MRILAKYLIFVSVVFLSIHAEADTSSNCDAPEVIDIGEGFKYHNTLLCSGIEHMNAHRFRDAITAFETALSLRFLDVPNLSSYRVLQRPISEREISRTRSAVYRRRSCLFPF